MLITTVGPYLQHGEPFVAACAAAGTDYVDLTGEPEFVDRMYLAHHAAAERTGARIVHACGFDSIPHDLGAQFTVEQLPEDVPLQVRGYVTAGGRPSGGTFASSVGAMSRLRQASAAHRERRAAEPALTGGRRVRAVSGRPGYDKRVGRWVLPMPTIDPQIVVRSAAALERYGPEFSYSHFAAFKNPLMAAATVGGIGAFVAVAQLPPARPLLLKLHPVRAGAVARAAREVVVSGAVRRRGRRAPRRDRRSAAAIRATARRRRCWPSRRCAWRSTSCRRQPGW